MAPRKLVPNLTPLPNWAQFPPMVPLVDALSQKSETSFYVSPLSLVDPTWSLIHGAVACGPTHSVVVPVKTGETVGFSQGVLVFPTRETMGFSQKVMVCPTGETMGFFSNLRSPRVFVA